MRFIELENRIQESAATGKCDIGTGLIAYDNNQLVFTIKQPSRWQKNSEGAYLVAFGGIGGKLEIGETWIDCLQREAMEEVGSQVRILKPEQLPFYVDPDGNTTELEVDEAHEYTLPLFIFENRRSEDGRPPSTFVVVYEGRFQNTNTLYPLNDPAILWVTSEVLSRMSMGQLSIHPAELTSEQGCITSKIQLPENGVLQPVGTAAVWGKILARRGIQ